MQRFVIHPAVPRLLVLSILASALGLAAQSSSAAVVQEEALERGLYTAAQASRGRDIYRAHCSVCHGSRLDDGVAVALVGPDFLSKWATPARSLDDLFFVLRTTMPQPAAGSLAKDEYIDVLAYILERNELPAGEYALVSDPAVLRAARLEAAEQATVTENAPAPAFIRGEKGLTPTGSGPLQKELDTAAENPNDWLYHTHDYTGRRYVDLAQINRDNVGRLSVECAYQLGELSTFHSGPLVYLGVMYLTTLNVTAAIDAATCREKWRHAWEPLDRQEWVNNRGVAIKDGRVVRATPDGYLYALDAASGELLWARQVSKPSLGEQITMPPMIYEDLILIGPAGSENNISGWVGAFRLEDGEPAWRFETVPGATEGTGTWPNPKGIPLGGGAVWTPLSLDVERSELYVAVTNPAPDLAAHLRPGPNLYTNSLVALDVRTGELRWYEQLVPNDAHDWDLTQVSPLFGTIVNGQRRDVVATVGKDGVLRLLDRESHERLWETPITTQENVDVPLDEKGVRVCPGLLGGVLWNGPAYSPRTNALYVPVVDWCTTFALTDEVRFVEGELYMGGTTQMDAESESQGWLTAVDASTGEVLWRYRSERPLIAAVTATAGDLVFAGEVTGDFIALDARTGEVLYRFHTGGPMGGGIISYAVDGKQYVAAASGQGSFIFSPRGSPTLFVFALPE